MTDDREYCPLCGDDFDKHRKTCRFEGTVHGSEVVYCRETGNKVVACPCQRCGFDRSITATHGVPTKKKELVPPPVESEETELPPVEVKPPPVLPTEVRPPPTVKIKYKRQSDVLDLL